MSNQFGRNIRISIFGESHQPYVGITADGFPAGIEIDLEYMKQQLYKRMAHDTLHTGRHESDQPQIISGCFNGYTDGSPLTILFANSDVHSQDYQKNLLRPGHADFTAFEKYHGYQDYRGGGHFSGRLTVGLVAIGSICRKLLGEKGIETGTHVVQCLDYTEERFSAENLKDQIRKLQHSDFPVLKDEDELRNIIERVRNRNDSAGAVMETAVSGLPAGIGEPFFDSLEAQRSHALVSIGGIKGVSFGTGFAMAGHTGSEVNDPFTVRDGSIVTATNHNGGINGGISNGMPVIINTVFKPTSSIALPQQSVDYETHQQVTLQLEGRHDPAIFLRGAVVIDSMVGIVLADNLAGIYGQNWFK
ncbi:MAG: chorismate synthase [Erysipelotrichaceae bacterium]|nr:chorismate synthase [Erysipelotrichaceae bacterium]